MQHWVPQRNSQGRHPPNGSLSLRLVGKPEPRLKILKKRARVINFMMYKGGLHGAHVFILFCCFDIEAFKLIITEAYKTLGPFN
jgi:hypothetical protein